MSKQQPKTKLEHALQLENYKYTPDYIIQNFCPRSFGFTSPCLPSSGLKDCIKHWNEEVTNKDPGFQQMNRTEET